MVYGWGHTGTIRKLIGTIRAIAFTVAVLVASVAGTSRNAFAQVPAPSVISISPNSGPAAGGTAVTITGIDFTGATAVKFGATNAASFAINSARSITAVAPAGSGVVDVTVSNPGGTSATSAADQFTYLAAPSVTSISPNSGPATGGTSVTINGSNFTGATAVRFGATTATSFSVTSATSITATSPAGSGIVDVTVSNSSGNSAVSAADQFSYVAAPSVTSVAPNSGPAAGGTLVTINGSNFTGATAVKFGATAATSFSVTSATSITATSPAGSGIVDVTVSNSSGTSAVSAADQFTYVAAPSVTSVSPNTGPAAGGTSVTINGSNFTGVTAVRFGAAAATSFSVTSATSITATSPAGGGIVDVTVSNSSGTSAVSPADQFTYLALPSVTSISPNSGPAAGGTSVTITGSNFAGATAVRFGATAAASFTVTSATSISAISPAGSGTVDVTVSNSSGTSATGSADQFTYGLISATTALSSSRNPSSVGQLVTFTAKVTGLSPQGTIAFYDGAAQLGTVALASGTSTFTTATLAEGIHSITARYSGDANNVASTSAALTQTVSVRTDSMKLRQLQAAVTPMIAQMSGQAITGAIDSAIDAGFNGSSQTVVPNGSGFTFQMPVAQPSDDIVDSARYRTDGARVTRASGLPRQRAADRAGSLANGRHGGNGAPPDTRLIDLPAIPLPPGSGMPPNDETRFSPDEVILQAEADVTSEDITRMTRRFGLRVLTKESNDTLGRMIYTLRIVNGRSVPEVIRSIEGSRLHIAVQPNYRYDLTQDKSDRNVEPGDPAQYVVQKLNLPGAHQTTKGDNVLIAVIDSQVDSSQPDLVDRVIDRYDAGCGASTPDLHGTGMAGAIASHVRLLGVAPNANIIAICAFGGNGLPHSSSNRIVRGLDYAIQRGAKIVNMSFAGPLDPTLSQAIQIAREKGIVVIAAAGNNGPKSPPLYPGADRNVIAVTATDANDQQFSKANQGKYITIAAPGVDILVPAPGGGWQFTTGTSVATANVSGVAALLLSHKPSLKPEEIRAIIVATARHLGAAGINPQFGAGLVDPFKALQQLLSGKPASDPDNIKQLLASFDESKRIDDDFSALGYATKVHSVSKIPPAAPLPEWLAWFDVRGINFRSYTLGNDLSGTQVNAIAGLTHRLAPSLLVGVLGGYETFDFRSDALQGRLKGDGWTVGSYLGWKITQNIRFDTGFAYSGIGYQGSADLAAGSFSGNRWLVTGALTGTYNVYGMQIDPSARIYAMRENENAYTDALGSLQTARAFTTGRASGGVKMSYPLLWSATTVLTPYVGLYSDYYFNGDSAGSGVIAAATIPQNFILDGWSARAVGGFAATFGNGAQIAVGAERGGIGSNFGLWTYRARATLPFGAQ